MSTVHCGLCYVSLSGALAKGELPGATRERIALAVAEINGCDYRLAARTYLGRNVPKLDDAEIITSIAEAIMRHSHLRRHAAA